MNDLVVMKETDYQALATKAANTVYFTYVQ